MPWPGLPEPISAGSTPELLTSYRVESDDRLDLLATTFRWLDAMAGEERLRVRAVDASPEPWAARTAAVVAAAAGLDAEVTRSASSLAEAYEALLAATTTPCFALQFDDTLTPGVTPAWLRAATGLLEAAPGLVDAVCPPPRVRVDRDEDRRVLSVVPYAHDGGRYRFATGGWQRPLEVVAVEDHTFGVFDTVMWGFYFNNLVARVDDFRDRFERYRRELDPTVHGIELAAFEWRGPVWRRIAIPLGGVCLLDLDFAHTAAAVRGERPDQRALWEAVDTGWGVEVVPDELG